MRPCQPLSPLDSYHSNADAADAVCPYRGGVLPLEYILYLKQGGGVFRLAECVEDSYCSSTIIFPHARPHVSTNLISRFLLSTLAAEAWRATLGVLF